MAEFSSAGSTFEVEVTQTRLERVRPYFVLAWASQAMWLDQLAPWMVSRGGYYAMVTLSLCGLTLSAMGYLLACRQMDFFLYAGGFFLVLACLLLGLGYDSIYGARKRFIVSQCGRGVEKTIRRTANQAPFTVTYTLFADHYYAKSAALGIEKQIEGRKLRLAYYCDECVCVYGRRYSIVWAGVVYFDSPDQQAAFLDFLRNHRVELIEIPSREDAELPLCPA